MKLYQEVTDPSILKKRPSVERASSNLMKHQKYHHLLPSTFPLLFTLIHISRKHNLQRSSNEVSGEFTVSRSIGGFEVVMVVGGGATVAV
ncbi:hypothetical protein Tco_0936933 [Tanacetum coccineum]|uniref:Uncharacterized protein n=1 Tax=Tanacetum coccineum TaxID=301880 RepID=A0ABQ5DER8_9ASTR